MLQLEAVVPRGTSWRDFHAFVGRYHKSQFETAVGDLGMLRAAWESAAEVSLPYAAWLYIAEVQLEETCSLVLDLIRIPCAVYTVYSQGS